MSIIYEWCVESVTDDDVQDIVELSHWDTFAECVNDMKTPPQSGEFYRVCLIRNEFARDDESDLIDRQWAYIENGILDSVFDGGAKVPARFKKEIA